MKIDKRLSEEFGTPLPPVSWLPSVERTVDLILGNAIPVSVNALLLGIGALSVRYVPGITLWFFGVAALAILPVIVGIVLVLVANSLDIPDSDGDYPGS